MLYDDNWRELYTAIVLQAMSDSLDSSLTKKERREAFEFLKTDFAQELSNGYAVTAANMIKSNPKKVAKNLKNMKLSDEDAYSFLSIDDGADVRIEEDRYYFLPEDIVVDKTTGRMGIVMKSACGPNGWADVLIECGVECAIKVSDLELACNIKPQYIG